MPTFETRDHVRLFYTDWGSGPALVFLHGWAVGGTMWEPQTLSLSRRGLRCIALDQRGCGRSDDPGYGYDYDTLADDLAALLDHLDLRDATLVGHSMGGGTITRYLTRHGAGRVARAVFIATTTPYLLQTDDNPDGIPKRVFDEVIDAVSEDRPRYFAEIAPGFFGRGLPGCAISEERVQWGVQLALQASPRATVEMTRTNSETDQRQELRQVTVPVLVIHGDADSGSPLDRTARPTAALLPDAELKIYENAPHGLTFTHAERLNADLVDWMTSSR